MRTAPRYRAVVFDLFDTLTVPYDGADYSSTLAAMAASLGAAPVAMAEVWDRNWPGLLAGAFPDTGAAVRRACRDLGVTAGPAPVETAGAAWDGYMRRASMLRSDALSALAGVRRAGHRIGLISDCVPGVPLLWRGTPAAPLVDAAVFSCEVRLTKPDPRIYLHACARLGVSPEACVYVADGVGRELTGAARLGMTAVLLRSAQPPDAFRSDAREWRGPTVAAPGEVLDLLGELGR